MRRSLSSACLSVCRSLPLSFPFSLAISTVAIAFILALPSASYADFTYTTNNLAITITGHTNPVGHLDIPDTIEGYPVTRIGYMAFSKYTELTGVTIPDSVTSILLSFLGLTNLTYIHVHSDNSKYSSLEGVLFNKDRTLLIQYPGGKVGSYNIPYGVTRIWDLAFAWGVGLTRVTIPDSVTSIGDSAFRDCTILASVTIPGSITNIGHLAFYNCSSLTSIDLPDSVTSIGSAAFRDCTSLSSIAIPSSVTSIEDSTFSGCTSLASITIPGSITSIGNSTFYNCSSLTSIDLPDSVTSIGSAAFSGCATLTSVAIGDGVLSIGASAFSGCTSLTSVKFAGNAPLSVGSNVFLSSNPTIYRRLSATGWGDTFAGHPVRLFCHSTSFVFSISANKVAITGHIQPSGSLVIPTIIEGYPVTSIGSEAFRQYSAITDITIPEGVLSIGSLAFRECSNLTSVRFAGNAPSFGSDVFPSSNPTIYRRLGAAGWGDTFAGRPVLMFCMATDFVFTFSKDEIAITGHIQPSGSLVIPTIIEGYPVTSIGSEAFRQYSAITDITIPEGVLSIGSLAFRECSNLANINVHIYNSEYSSLDGVLFNKDQTILIQYPEGRVGEYMIPDSVTSIGDSAFSGCSSLTSINTGKGAASIGNWAFSGCSALTSVTTGINVTNIGSLAFFSCPDLTSVKFTGNAPSSVGSNVFLSSNPTIYRRLGAAGWSDTFAGRPVRLWPEATAASISPAGLTFSITASDDQQFIVEAASALIAPDWQPIYTGTVISAESYDFTDPDAASHPQRFYRVSLD